MSFASMTDWMVWGIALLVAFPLLIIALGEMADDAYKSPIYRAYTKPLLITRNAVLPLAFAAILLRKVVGLGGEHIAVKIIDTALWIVVLNAAVALMNVALFDEKSGTAGRIGIPRLLLDILRFIFVVCGAAVTISTIWGVNLGSLVTALGVGSVVIGLALQDTLGSLFSGIAMVSARQFRVGDWVRFGNDEGPIMSQNWRTVTIKTRNGDALIVPNGVIARAPITVLAAGAGSTQIGVDLKFPYQYSPDKISALLVEAAKMTTGFVLDPPPVARVAAFDDNGIRYGMGVKAVDPSKLFAVRGEFLANVWFLAQRAGITMVGQLNVNFPVPEEILPPAPNSPESIQQRLLAIEDFGYRNANLSSLLARARLERYRNGQSIFERGAVVESVYVLLTGTARATHANSDGSELVLQTFGPAQFMLAKATLRRAAMPYTLKAVGEIEVVAVPVADFNAFCSTDIKIAQEIEQILSAREDAAHRGLAKSQANGDDGDRSQLMRSLFQP